MIFKYACFISYPYGCKERYTQTFVRHFTDALASEMTMQGVQAEMYVAALDMDESAQFDAWGTRVPSTLRPKITAFLASLPNLQDSPAQRAFIASIGIDRQLENQLQFGLPIKQFIDLIVSKFSQYGKFADGRNAIETVLEVAKQHIGKEGQDYSDTLIHALREHASRRQKQNSLAVPNSSQEYHDAHIKALCMSGCMILVFTPAYFKNKQSQLACAVEYKLMEKFEQERIKLLGLSSKKASSMIIPVIYRGEMSKCPNEIKAHRQWYDFSHYIFQEQGFFMDREHAPKVQAIAQQIAEIHEYMEALSADEQEAIWRCWRKLAKADSLFASSQDDPCETCDDPKFSETDLTDIKTWLKQMTIPSSPFPGRKEE